MDPYHSSIKLDSKNVKRHDYISVSTISPDHIILGCDSYYGVALSMTIGEAYRLVEMLNEAMESAGKIKTNGAD